MKKEPNSAFVVFIDCKFLEIEKMVNLKPFPIVVLDKETNIYGIMDEISFWKGVSLKGKEQTINQFVNQNFKSIEKGEDLSTYSPTHYDYFIEDSGGSYTVYSSEEVKDLKMEGTVRLISTFQEELSNIRFQIKELQDIINSSYDEIFVTDALGNTLFISESCKKITGFPPEVFLNRNVLDLAEKGVISNSVVLKVMKSKKTESGQQVYPNGKTVVSTAKPIFDDNGQLHRIISNTRDITELADLRSKLAQINQASKTRLNMLENDKFHSVFEKLVTCSDQMFQMLELIEKVASTDSSIFISGESGVGKGMIAKIIHDLSNRKKGNFIQVNCGAIPRNLIESELFGYEGGAFTGSSKEGKMGLAERADGGTLFLDEIGELPLELQVKLLHLVQEKAFTRVGGTRQKEVDIRIISATNKNLEEMIQTNLFREDLYYRLHVVPIRVPALRHRREDIPLLIEHFVSKFNNKYLREVEFTESAVVYLQNYDWPGNIRELENLIEQIVVTSQQPTIYLNELPDHVKKQKQKSKVVEVNGILPLKTAVEETERQILELALEKYKTSRTIAKHLGVNQTTIIRKLNKLIPNYLELQK